MSTERSHSQQAAAGAGLRRSGSRRAKNHFTSSSLHKESCGERYCVSNRWSSLTARKRFLSAWKVDRELRQRGAGILQGERLPVEPERGVLFGKPLLAVQLPLAKAEIAQPVEPTRKATGEEDAMEMVWRPDVPHRLIEYFRRRALAIFALSVRPMGLIVMGGHPTLMLHLGTFPAGHLGEMEISKPSLKIKVTFDKIFPRLLFANLLLLDVEFLVDELRLFGDKDVAAVADEDVGRAVLTNGLN